MTSSTRRLLPVASTGCACCAPASVAVQAAPAAEAPASTDTFTTYQVEGMTCGSCARRVTETITALENVTDVRIELVAGGTSAVVVTGSADPQTVQAAIEQAGYITIKS